MTEPQRVITENARPDSISISRTSKGFFSWECKLYGDANTGEGMKELVNRMHEWVQALNQAYPAEVKENK